MKTPKGTQSETIHAPWWPDGEDAEVKTFLSGWDTLLLGDHMEQVRADAAEQGLSQRATTYLSALAYLTQTVVSTTRRHHDGTPVRVTLDDFKRLPMDDVNFLLDATSARVGLWSRPSPAATEEERRSERFQAGGALPVGDGGEAQSERHSA